MRLVVKTSESPFLSALRSTPVLLGETRLLPSPGLCLGYSGDTWLFSLRPQRAGCYRGDPPPPVPLDAEVPHGHIPQRPPPPPASQPHGLPGSVLLRGLRRGCWGDPQWVPAPGGRRTLGRTGRKWGKDQDPGGNKTLLLPRHRSLSRSEARACPPAARLAPPSHVLEPRRPRSGNPPLGGGWIWGGRGAASRPGPSDQRRFRSPGGARAGWGAGRPPHRFLYPSG